MTSKQTGRSTVKAELAKAAAKVAAEKKAAAFSRKVTDAVGASKASKAPAKKASKAGTTSKNPSTVKVNGRPVPEKAPAKKAAAKKAAPKEAGGSVEAKFGHLPHAKESTLMPFGGHPEVEWYLVRRSSVFEQYRKLARLMANSLIKGGAVAQAQAQLKKLGLDDVALAVRQATDSKVTDAQVEAAMRKRWEGGPKAQGATTRKAPAAKAAKAPAEKATKATKANGNGDVAKAQKAADVHREQLKANIERRAEARRQRGQQVRANGDAMKAAAASKRSA